MIVTTDEEKSILRAGGQRLATLVQEVAGRAVPGVSTLELEEFVRTRIKEMGDTPAFLDYKPRGARRAFPAALCCSINEEIVHGIPNEDPRILQEGDIVALDIGLVHQGFVTDHAITVAVGNVSAEDERLMRATQEALAAGITAAKLGNTLGDIGFAVEHVAAKYGYAYPAELGGHGVGKGVHEEPFVANWGEPGKGIQLQEGMVLALEPMLHAGTDEIVLAPDGYTYRTADGKKSAHFEHTILITDGDAEILTKT